MPTETPDSPALSRKFLKEMRAIAHHLNPIVTLGAEPSESALAELDRALRDHELIKVRVQIADRKARDRTIDEITAAAGAEQVQRIGKVVVLYRTNPEAKPERSNVARFSRT